MNIKKLMKTIGIGRDQVIRDRIKVRAIHGMSFIFDKFELPLVNISSTGLGLLAHPEKKFENGEIIDGNLKTADGIFQLTIEVVHQTGQMTGCRIKNADNLYQAFLKKYFSSELEGLKLQEMDSDRLSEDANGTPHWHFSDTDHELYYTVRNDEITSIQITYQNYVIVVDPEGNLSTGAVWEDERSDGMDHKSSDLVKGDGGLPEDIKGQIIRFIGAINKIEKSDRQKIEKILEKKFNL